MKILIVNTFDINGGAARAAYRIHRALLKSGIESRMCVAAMDSDDWTVSSHIKTFWMQKKILGTGLHHFLKKFYQNTNQSFHSPSWLPSLIDRKINASGFDLVNLHWVCADFLSIEAIGRIRKPIVWTLHDMWAFCGAENYAPDNETARFRQGYVKRNRPPEESGLDINRWVWRRKQKAWQNPMTVVAPSRWLADCAKASFIMRDWRIEVIPNAIDLNVWRMLPKEQSRSLMNIPSDTSIILFVAAGGSKDQRKGFDLLLSALGHLKNIFSKPITLHVMGQSKPQHESDLGFPVRWLGHLHDDLSLNMAYSSADLVVIPSRQDNLPNIGLEALASGTPVVAFDTGGLPDIVFHQKTGWLAKAFDPEHLAKGICWVLEDEQRHKDLCEHARAYAVEHFSADNVAKLYIDLYESVLAGSRGANP